MYTECPHCQSLFRIHPHQLRAAGGAVRCGRCSTPFNALETLREAAFTPGPVAPGDVGTADTVDTGHETPALSELLIADDKPAHEPDPPLPAPPPARDNPAQVASGAVPLHLRRALAEAEAAAPRRHPLRTALGAAAVLALTALLLAQVVFFRASDVLAAAPQLRPWLEPICAAAGCTLITPRAPERIVLLNHDVRTHPEVEGALLIKATFANHAQFAQPYPGILITLSDLGGNRVARRGFTPDEYLPEALQVSTHDGGPALMSPETPVYIDLEVLDPGAQALNYQFDFF